MDISAQQLISRYLIVIRLLLLFDLRQQLLASNAAIFT
jgi:hypothetical protein